MQHPYGPSVATFVRQAEESLDVLTSKSRATSSARGSPKRWNYLARRRDESDDEMDERRNNVSSRRQEGLRRHQQDVAPSPAGRVGSPEAQRLVHAWLRPRLTGSEPLEQALRTLSEGETEVREHLGIFAKTMLEVDKRLRVLERQAPSKESEDRSPTSPTRPLEDSAPRLAQRINTLEERILIGSNHLKAIEQRVDKELEDLRCRLVDPPSSEAAQPSKTESQSHRDTAYPVATTFDTRQEFEALKRNLEASISATLAKTQVEVHEQLESDRRAFEEFFEGKSRQLREMRESMSPVGASILPPTVPIVPQSEVEVRSRKECSAAAKDDSSSAGDSDQCTIKSFAAEMGCVAEKAHEPSGSATWNQNRVDEAPLAGRAEASSSSPSSSSAAASRRVSELAPLPLSEAVVERQVVKDVSMSACNSREPLPPLPREQAAVSNMSDSASNDGQDYEEVPNTPLGSESIRTTSTMVRRAAAYIGMQDPVALKTSPKSRLASPSATIAGARSFSDLENITANAELFGMSLRSSRLGSPTASSSAPPAASPFLQNATRSDRLGSWVGRPDPSSSKSQSQSPSAPANVTITLAGVGTGTDADTTAAATDSSAAAPVCGEEAEGEGCRDAATSSEQVEREDGAEVKAAASSSAKPAESLVLPLLSWAEAASAEIPAGLPSRARLARAGGLGRPQADPSLWADIFAELRHALLNANREGQLESLGASLDFDYRLSVFLLLYKTSSTRIRQNVSQELIQRLIDCDSWAAGGAPQEAAEIAASQPPVASPQERDGGFSTTGASSSRLFFSPIGEREDDHSTTNFYSPVEAKATVPPSGLNADFAQEGPFGIPDSNSRHSSTSGESIQAVPFADAASVTSAHTSAAGSAAHEASLHQRADIDNAHDDPAHTDGSSRRSSISNSSSSQGRSTGTVVVAPASTETTLVGPPDCSAAAGSPSPDPEQISNDFLRTCGLAGSPQQAQQTQPAGSIGFAVPAAHPEATRQVSSSGSGSQSESEGEKQPAVRREAQKPRSDPTNDDESQEGSEDQIPEGHGDALGRDFNDDIAGAGGHDDTGSGGGSDSDSVVGAVLGGDCTDDSDVQESAEGEDIEEVLRRVSTTNESLHPTGGPGQSLLGDPAAPPAPATMGMWDDLLDDLAGPADHNTVEIQSISDDNESLGAGWQEQTRPSQNGGAAAAAAAAAAAGQDRGQELQQSRSSSEAPETSGSAAQQQHLEGQRKELVEPVSEIEKEVEMESADSRSEDSFCAKTGLDEELTPANLEVPAGHARRPSASSVEVHDFAASDILTLSESMPASAATSGLPSPNADHFGRIGNAAPPTTSGGSVPSLSSAAGVPSTIETVARSIAASSDARLESLSAPSKDVPKSAALHEASEVEREAAGAGAAAGREEKQKDQGEQTAAEEDEDEVEEDQDEEEEEEEEVEYYYEEGEEEEELEGDEEEELSEADEAGYVVNVVRDTE